MNIELAPESCGLIIVDMQTEGCERHGPTLKPVIKNIRNLLDRFRAANGKIIHVQSVRTKDHPEFTVFGKEYSLIDGTPAVEFIDELKPLPGELRRKEILPRLLLPNDDGRHPHKRSTCAPAGTGSSLPASAPTTASITP